MSIIEKKLDSNSWSYYFEHTESGRKFRRVVGGFAWPGKKPGYIVSLGQELEPDPTTKTRHLWVVGETEDFDVETLFRKAVEFLNLYQVQDFCGDNTDRPMMSLLRQSTNRSGFALVAAPQIDEERNFSFYIQTIKRRLHPDTKDLHFGETSRIPGYLLEVPPEEVISATVLDYPAVAALGYAVAYIDIYRPLPPLPPQINIARTYVPNLDFWKRRG